ncbi:MULTISPECIES: response regulator transcription factor [Virgibacillus]|uniref:Response regulator transcription factor n=1 Tax=Virgibacillus salarius TaxID=447199 RepID=A0A941I8E3_9BACI|nr:MULTISPECIES: response regulator transcription factor [Bacillaceae]MBR7795484.1 response regulator transcription factor [Virgibacillus salarius]NAZ08197.1 response regulator [Agaribacter marinus]WBX80501.1 response regulator transcription factor [Virgibacillus salarius]
MNDASIVVADDEKEIADLLAIHLEKEGYKVHKVYNGKEAMKVIDQQSIDLVILDIMMPEMDGYEVTRLIREKHNMPIIFLSAKTSEFDKVQGLVIGGDDYMIKPFSPMELMARVQAQLRRYKKLNETKLMSTANMEFGELTISKEEHVVYLLNEKVELTRKEFEILYLLAKHPRKVYSVDKIMQIVWGDTYYDGANTVMVHIRTLRKKLKEDKRKNKFIKTVWGVGYTFDG